MDLYITPWGEEVVPSDGVIKKRRFFINIGIGQSIKSVVKYIKEYKIKMKYIKIK